MFVSECLGVNRDGHLTIGGVDTLSLAGHFGTPVYVMDEGEIRKNCRLFKDSITRYYDGNGLVCYASKAFSCKEIYRITGSEGMGIDVVSQGELFTALEAGFDPALIVMHGNNKTPEDLLAAIRHKVGRIVVDGVSELHLLDQLAASAGVRVNILFRIRPGVEAHTHEYIKTGQIDSKFGLALEGGEAMEAVKLALSMKHLNLVGMHCHIGSQIFDNEPFELTAEIMMRFFAEIRERFGHVIREFNIGGGHGIMYTQEDCPSPFEEFMERVAAVIKRESERLDFPQPFILMEPGRSIVGPAGITLYTVGSIKEIPDVRTYVSVDGGMTDNPRFALYQSRYTVVAAARASEPAAGLITLAGRCCESGDILGKDMPVQKLGEGDVVAMLATGAYNYSMASNYNRLPRPPVVMIRDGEPRVIVRRESLEDLVRNDV